MLTDCLIGVFIFRAGFLQSKPGNRAESRQSVIFFQAEGILIRFMACAMSS